MNEAAGFRGYRNRSLTKEQQQEALAAVYGVEPNPFMQQQFSAEQLEQMRMILAQHDSGSQRDQMKSFDINNPPKEPYVYREFPRCMYHHTRQITRNAQNHEHMQTLIEQGFSKEPFPVEAVEEALEVTAAEAAEIARLDKIAKQKKAKA